MAITFLGHKNNGSSKGLVVDHINNIKTDNSIDNLQLISQRENSSKDKKNGTSKYIGVYWNKEKHKWTARIQVNGFNKHIGHFNNEIDAHLAYEKTKTRI